VPAGVLVLVVLGAIAVDAAVAFLGQREVSNAAAAAANDAVVVGLSDRAFYTSGLLEVDEARALDVARRAVLARASRGVEVVDVSVTAEGARVCVTVRGRVPYVFGRALPFVRSSASVQGRAGATAVAGAAGTAAPRGVDC
jgi:Flp pilus assembly protein TadG